MNSKLDQYLKKFVTDMIVFGEHEADVEELKQIALEEIMICKHCQQPIGELDKNNQGYCVDCWDLAPEKPIKYQVEVYTPGGRKPILIGYIRKYGSNGLLVRDPYMWDSEDEAMRATQMALKFNYSAEISEVRITKIEKISKDITKDVV